jgi:hypothetical protein
MARRKVASQNLKTAAPSLLLMGAIAAVLLGAFMTVKTYRTDQQIGALLHHGVGVSYHLSNCSTNGDSGFECQGDFKFHGATYHEDISGILDEPNNGTTLSAVVNPKSPASYVYVRSSVYGPNAAGRGSWLLGAILLGLLAVGMALLAHSMNSKRRSSVQALSPGDT